MKILFTCFFLCVFFSLPNRNRICKTWVAGRGRMLGKSVEILETNLQSPLSPPFPGEIFPGLSAWKNRRKNPVQKSTATIKSEFGSFEAKIHTARISPGGPSGPNIVKQLIWHKSGSNQVCFHCFQWPKSAPKSPSQTVFRPTHTSSQD